MGLRACVTLLTNSLKSRSFLSRKASHDRRALESSCGQCTTNTLVRHARGRGRGRGSYGRVSRV